MKKLIWMMISVALLWSCQDSNNQDQESDFTGNEVVYPLQPDSEYNVNGTVTFKEKKDGSTLIRVALSGTEGSIQHPVHIHLGEISAPGADVYANLTPVLGKTGISETVLTRVSDESTITYKQLVALNACMKIHLAADGPSRDIILAAGNIGSNAAKESSTGRLGIGVCKSE